MLFRNLDADGDWIFGKGKHDYVSDSISIALNIRTRLLSWVGDCFFDINAGVDWLNRLGSKNQVELLKLDLRRVLLQSFGVTSIEKIDIVFTERNFTATYTINTIYTKAYVDSINLEI